MRATSQNRVFSGSLSFQGGVRESCPDGVDYAKLEGIKFLEDWWQGRCWIVYGWRPPSGHTQTALQEQSCIFPKQSISWIVFTLKGCSGKLPRRCRLCHSSRHRISWRLERSSATALPWQGRCSILYGWRPPCCHTLKNRVFRGSFLVL